MIILKLWGKDHRYVLESTSAYKSSGMIVLDRLVKHMSIWTAGFSPKGVFSKVCSGFLKLV
jgi:hypothetical protein